MPVYEGIREIDIDAAPEDCIAILTDFERLPEWSARVRRAEVLTRDEAGRGRDVAYELDATVRTIRYRLRHVYDVPHRVVGEYLGGDLECFDADYRFAPLPGGGTHVTFAVKVDPGVRVPGFLARKLNEALMGRTLSELKERAEALAPVEGR